MSESDSGSDSDEFACHLNLSKKSSSSVLSSFSDYGFTQLSEEIQL